MAYRTSEAYKHTQSAQRFEREAGPPHAQCVSYTHDVDYARWAKESDAGSKLRPGAKDGKDKARMPPWCPPQHARHLES